jgi:hypothetical protein
MDLVNAEGGEAEVVHCDAPAVAPNEHFLLLLTSVTPMPTINRDTQACCIIIYFWLT